MKPLAFAAVAALVAASCGLTSPVLAQNASQIARVRAGAGCPGCNLFQADLTYGELGGRNYAGARLRQADLSFGVFSGANFSRGDLRDLNAAGAVFSSANFSGANLANATLVGAHLEGASFAGANLDGANFGGAEMASARGLTQAQLNRACGDEDTRLPRGLHLRAC